MLYLLPNLLDLSSDHTAFLPKSVDEAMYGLDGLFAEDEKNARVFLKRFTYSNGRTFRDIPIKLLNEHTKQTELQEHIGIVSVQNWGVISDAGLVCLADPGSMLVKLAREKKIPIKTFPGPSSIIMAIQLSGIFSQSFTFLGYLPRDAKELEAAFIKMEKEMNQEKRTQVFIEAPYRNQKLLEAFVSFWKGKYRLCVAADLTMPSESIEVHHVDEWKKKDLTFYNKRAAVFVLGI